jgi:hypothetical protein
MKPPEMPVYVRIGDGPEIELGTLTITKPRNEVTHRCPPGDSGIMPCCGRTPFEVPRSDRLTSDTSLTTCGTEQL